MITCISYYWLGEKKNIFSFLRIAWSSIVKPWVSFTWGCIVASLVEIGSVSVEKKILKFCQCIFAILSLSPLGNDVHVALHLSKLESFLPKDAWSQASFKLAQWVWRRRFLNFIVVFSLFQNYLLLPKGLVLHLTKLEFPPTKDALCKV